MTSSTEHDHMALPKGETAAAAGSIGSPFKTMLRAMTRARVLFIAIIGVLLASCAHAPHVVVLAFPHGGMAGADGLRADTAATAEAASRGVTIEHVNLDSGVVNPHEDEGTDDQRAQVAAKQLNTLLKDRGDVAGIVVGPTRAIADAVRWRSLPFPTVAVAPLVQDIRCSCSDVGTLFREEPRAVVESVEGDSWTDARGRTYPRLAAAAANVSIRMIVNRRGDRYRVPAGTLSRLLSDPDAIDRAAFEGSAFGLTLLQRFDVPQAARAAVSLVLRGN